MTPEPTGRSSNPYATYVDLDTAEQPQNVYPRQPPPPANAPPPPPVASLLPPQQPERRTRGGFKVAGAVLVVLLLAGAGRTVVREHRQKARACGVITTAVAGPAGSGAAQATAEQGAAFLDRPIDPGEIDRQRREDAHNRAFAGNLFLHPRLRAALIGIADDMDALIDVRLDTQGDRGERATRAARLGDALNGHVAAAREACR
ncbi:hypothetical protein ACQP2P_19625 [Dactylosporangium sp. CA-139114]|uniref:hypothetical protein n=1 Tax=Dactylosporangium sp. CA-139114 TaxID=3239931 RepID=UPI003D98002E